MIPPPLKKTVNSHYETVLKNTGYFEAYPPCL
jgi:hypothetical protein